MAQGGTGHSRSRRTHRCARARQSRAAAPTNTDDGQRGDRSLTRSRTRWRAIVRRRRRQRREVPRRQGPGERTAPADGILPASSAVRHAGGGSSCACVSCACACVSLRLCLRLCRRRRWLVRMHHEDSKDQQYPASPEGGGGRHGMLIINASHILYLDKIGTDLREALHPYSPQEAAHRQRQGQRRLAHDAQV